MNSLPADLLDQIFFRLTIKDLVLCSCVCKPWLSSIKHPRFIDEHHKRQRNDMLMIRYWLDDNKEIYSLRVDDDDFFECKGETFPLVQSWRDNYRVVGSCNGVICVTDDQYQYRYAVYLWNPSIHKCVVVPYPNITYLTVGPCDQVTGFGYDARTSDYKVVRVVESCGCMNKPLEVELYSTNTGVWRSISHIAQNILCKVQPSREMGRQAFVNGASHWIVMDNMLSRLVILAFHYGDEVFRCIESPVATTTHYFDILWPAVVKGSLSLYHRAKGICCLWVMKEYEDSSSWTKQWNNTDRPPIGRVFGFRKEGQFLVEREGNLYSFDPNERSSDVSDESNCRSKELGLRSGTESWQSSFHSESYIESLALLGAPMSIGHKELASLREELASRFSF